MRPIVMLIGLALVVPLLPSAAADHIGPCWHEYIEGIKDPVGTIKACSHRLVDSIPVEIACASQCLLLP